MVRASFERVAESVTHRTAELFSAPVSVVDDQGVVVSSTEPGAVGLAFDIGPRAANGLLRLPIRLHGHTGEVLVAEPPGGESVPPRLAQALVDLVVDQAAVVERLPGRQELRGKFIHDLLHGAIGDEADALREAQVLGMDFSRPRAVILIDAADHILAWRGSAQRESEEAAVRRRAEQVIQSVVRYFNLPSAAICAYIGDGEVAVLKASTTQDLVPWADGVDRDDQLSPSWANLAALKRAGAGLLAWLRRGTNASISVGIGRYHPGIRGLERSYRDARAALSLGRRFHGPNRMHCLDGLGVAAFVGVAEERTKIELATHLLSPLDGEPELLETLRAFFEENCCPSLTARRLAIHRNTLSYRLDKVSSLTGLDPRRFDDAVQIRLALLLRSLVGEAA
jgi:carbohydrate diacid regulator